MTKRQKHKGKKRPRSWHRRGAGPDTAYRWAMRRLVRAGINNVAEGAK
jgi:hypothetical protein